MIDLSKLQVFAVVAEAGTFSAAAAQLYITQSAVSHHMKDLEAGLGQQLFRRGRRGVTLTSEGEILANYAREIFRLIAQAENDLTNVQRLASGKVSIGATPGAGIYLVPQWVLRFRAQYPNLTVALHTGVTSQIVSEVLARHLDIGIVEGELDDFPQSRLSHLIIENVEQKVVIGFKHAFWDVDSIQLSDLNQQSFIVRPPNSQSRIWLDRKLMQHRIEPKIGAEFDNLESMKRAVATGLCLAILPPYVVQDEVRQNLLHLVPVEGKPFIRPLKLIWDREVRFSPVTYAFLEELSQHYPSIKTIPGGN